LGRNPSGFAGRWARELSALMLVECVQHFRRRLAKFRQTGIGIQPVARTATPGGEAEVRVLPRRIAVGPGRCNHSARTEVALPGDGWRLGLSQPTNCETLRFWLAAEEGAQGRDVTSQDPRDGSAGIRFATAIALGSTKRVLHSACSRN
jgi:hypothetical protein